MAVRLAINGFGRIGRLVLRALIESGRNDLEIVGINDLGPVDTNAHLLRYDTVHGRYAGTIATRQDGMDVGRGWIRVTAERDPAKLPWAELGVDIALECTGLFTDKAKASAHLAAGAKRVLISAPSADADITVVYGINDDAIKAAHKVVSNGSCTTNCVVPVAYVLHQAVGIERGFMTTVHSYTNDQNVQDLPHKDMYRARAAAQNIIPTTTGAAKAVSLVIPELKGKLTGIAMRVPVPTGSIVDLTSITNKPVTVEAVNTAMKAAANGPMKGILEYTEDPIVSSDIIGNPHSSIFAADLTEVIEGNLVKVISWYDNEYGYSSRTADLISRIARL